MMVITRSVGESVRIGDAIVKVGKVAGEYCKLVISAPRSTPIVRAELLRNTRHREKLEHVFQDLQFAASYSFRGTIS